MCFSASASFSAGAALLGLGGLSLKAVQAPRELAFASIPLLFAAQQFVEGALWLGFGHDASASSGALTWVYAVFAHVLWPAFMPLAVLAVEPAGTRRRLLLGIACVGLATAAWILFSLLAGGVVARPSGGHIEYVSTQPHAVATTAFYVAAATLAPLLSSHRAIRAFGVLSLAAFAATHAFYEAWLVSVWCYFAALLSVVVLLHFQQRRPARTIPTPPTIAR